MCGISAIVEFDDAAGARTARDLAAMHARIAHRGPNGEGFLFVDEKMRVARGETLAPLLEVAPSARVGIAFRWLAVQDLDPAAAQPMAAAGGRVHVAFNGEIYNFVELREELETLGWRFRTKADTEVIAAAYEAWGSECLGRFEGMWAILIVDAERRRLVGSRDRFGIKPLFWAAEKSRLLFASEAKQILAAQKNTAIHEPWLYEFLHGRRQALDDGTFYRALNVVPAASRFEIDLAAKAPAIRFETWWDLSRLAAAPRLRLDEETAAREVDALLRSSVRRHLRACVKVASFVSGGLDSTLLTALVAREAPEAHESYSLVFDRTRYARFDESAYVDEFLRATPVPNFRTTFGPEWLRDNMRTLTLCQDEPLIASTLLAQYRAFELAKEREAVVVLDGQGSDEVFGGYPGHELAVWRERLVRGRLADFAREARILARNAGVSMSRLAWNQLIRSAAGALVRRFRLPYGRYAWIDEAWFRARRGGVPPEEARRRREIAAWPSRLERLLYAEMRYTSLPQLFLFSDHSGMAHSIEARLPYLDHRLVEFVVQLPPELKTGFGIRKRLLRRVARPYLPASIVDRKDKMGFVTPEAAWLRRELKDDLLALGRSRALASLPFLHMPRLRSFVSAYLEGRHGDFRAVWRLYALRHWIEAFEPSA